MSRSTAGGLALIAVGVVFMAVARSVAIGATFVVIGIVFIARRRRPR